MAARASRAAEACADRTRSMARRCASVISQLRALPCPGSNRAAVRQTSSSTSWVTSSDWAGSRTTRRTRPYTRVANRSYTPAKAASSPRATLASSAARSPLEAAWERSPGNSAVIVASSSSRFAHHAPYPSPAWPGRPAVPRHDGVFSMIRGRRPIGLARALAANPCRLRQRIEDVTVSSDPQLPPPGRPRIRPGVATGLFTGLITAAVALGVGQLVAGLTGSIGSPVVAVGGASIDLTPPPVKDFAISTFGAHDKTALVSGILVLLAIFAGVVGVAAVRRFSYGVAGLAVFTTIGLTAALTRPTAQLADALPSLAGGAAALFAMARLVRAAPRGAALPAPAGPGEDPGEPPGAAASPGPGAAAGPGASWVPGQAAGQPGAHRASPGAGQAPSGR